MNFAEIGMIGVVAVLFAGLIKFLQKTMIEKLDKVEKIKIN